MNSRKLRCIPFSASTCNTDRFCAAVRRSGIPFASWRCPNNTSQISAYSSTRRPGSAPR
ncbi:MAG: hypothetical protein HC917_27870 [Richelia sp. SM2_1_7]|nr:hypothetical protein [Richelia sp. SM2_1_7]